jgi:glycine dehydrogenase subunit 1
MTVPGRLPLRASAYIANTDADRRAMLDVIGVDSSDELFADIPAEFHIAGLDLPPALSEAELARELSALAKRNRPAGEMPCFLGGGAYRHFIPSVVREVVGRSEFATAYTPYQAEISQGTQTAFEFSSWSGELTGTDVANAVGYDGASACRVCPMAAGVSGAAASLFSPACIPTLRRSSVPTLPAAAYRWM